MKNLLRFQFGNGKLDKGIAIFNLPAGHSCPFAKLCLAKANRQVDEGQGRGISLLRGQCREPPRQCAGVQVAQLRLAEKVQFDGRDGGLDFGVAAQVHDVRSPSQQR